MFRLFASLFLLLCTQLSADHLNWYTNYQEALQTSKSTSKPIVLFFTGSDWCTWCTKLEKEALDTPEFIEAVNDKLIFVKLDFPRKGNGNQALATQNETLQKKYAIRGYPTIILINSEEQQIGTTGYRPGGGKVYAEHLISMIQDSGKKTQ